MVSPEENSLISSKLNVIDDYILTLSVNRCNAIALPTAILIAKVILQKSIRHGVFAHLKIPKKYSPAFIRVFKKCIRILVFAFEYFWGVRTKKTYAFSFTSSHLGSWGLVSIFPFRYSLLYPSLSLLSLLIDFPLYLPHFPTSLKTSLESLCFPFSSFSSSFSFPSSFTSFESFTRPFSHRTYLPLVDLDLLLLYCFSSTLS